jgi:hypothetical protein
MWPIILLVGGFLAVGGVVAEYKKPAKPPVQTRPAPPSEDAKGALALLVRLSGELCARVVSQACTLGGLMLKSRATDVTPPRIEMISASDKADAHMRPNLSRN